MKESAEKKEMTSKAPMEEKKEEIVKKPKASLEQLIRKKLERDDRKTAVKEIYVKGLDANLVVNNPSDARRIEFAEETKSGSSYADVMEAYRRLIYDCCPILHSKELQESIEVDYPYDTVKAIFDTDEVAQIGVEILRFFDTDKKSNTDEENDTDKKNNADEKLKN